MTGPAVRAKLNLPTNTTKETNTMAMTKSDFEAMASLISGQIPDLADVTDGRIFNEVGLRAVTRIAIGFMNQAYQGNRRFDGDKFLEWSGIGRWVEWHEGFASKEARWVESFRLVTP